MHVRISIPAVPALYRITHLYSVARIIALLAILLTTLSVTDASANKRAALIIGNNTYNHLPNLSNARRDAQDIADKLDSLGFATTLLLDATRRSIAHALINFPKDKEGYEAVLVYYAGHGISYENKNWIIPTDAQVRITEDLPYEALSLEHLIGRVSQGGSDLNIFIMDACRDNPLSSSTRGLQGGLSAVTATSPGVGTIIMYSAAAGQVALDGPPNGNGIFTGQLIRALDEKNISIEETFKIVARNVANITNGQQDPWVHSNFKGHFSFNLLEKTTDKNTSYNRNENGEKNHFNRPDKDVELVFWKSIQDSQNSDDYQAYLNAFPDGFFIQIAKNRLRKLKEGISSNIASMNESPQTTRNSSADDYAKQLDTQLAELKALREEAEAEKLELEKARREAEEAARLLRHRTEAEERRRAAEAEERRRAAEAEERRRAEAEERRRAAEAEERRRAAEAEERRRAAEAEERRRAAEAEERRRAEAEERRRAEAEERRRAADAEERRRAAETQFAGQSNNNNNISAIDGSQIARLSPPPEISSAGPKQKKVQKVHIERAKRLFGPFVRIGHGKTFITRFEVTLDLWEKCVKSSLCKRIGESTSNSGSSHPVTQVGIVDVSRFLLWANHAVGLENGESLIRLPTLAEWLEAASHSLPSFSAFQTRSDDLCEFENLHDDTAYWQYRLDAALECNDGFLNTAPVGSFKPNSLGIHDLMGNVSEFTSTCWEHRNSPAETRNPQECQALVVAGGSWFYVIQTEDSVIRRISVKGKSADIGFRIAISSGE